MKRIIFSLMCMVISITIFHSSVHAVDLWPMQVGTVYEYAVSDSADPQNNWTLRMEVLNTVTIGSYDYFTIGMWNYESGVSYQERIHRFTETANYSYDPLGDILHFQIAPVGTIWSSSDEDGQIIREIISIEPVTAPYGTFDNAYVHRNYFDPDDPNNPNSSYWYDYIVPGVGLVKEVDTGGENDPTTMELVNVSVAPEPISSTLFIIGGATLGFRRFQKKFRKEIN